MIVEGALCDEKRPLAITPVQWNSDTLTFAQQFPHDLTICITWIAIGRLQPAILHHVGPSIHNCCITHMVYESCKHLNALWRPFKLSRIFHLKQMLRNSWVNRTFEVLVKTLQKPLLRSKKSFQNQFPKTSWCHRCPTWSVPIQKSSLQITVSGLNRCNSARSMDLS